MSFSGADRPRWVGATAVVAALLGCSSGAPESGSAPEVAVTSPAIETTVPAPEPPTPSSSSTRPAPPEPPTELGEIEVGVTLRLPTVPVEWSTSTLTLPDQPDGTWVAYVAAFADGYVAVGFGWDPSGRQVVSWWRSDAGSEWTRSQLTLPEGAAMFDVTTFGDRLFATGTQVKDGDVEASAWSMSADARRWTPVDLGTPDIDLSGVWLAGVAANDAGIVIGGRRDHYEPSRPITFEAKGFRYEQHDVAGTYELFDAATGRLVASGRMDELFGWDADGHVIRDPATGERLTVVPWDAWTHSVARSPLPIPLPADFEPPPPLVVEADGFRITIDDGEDRYEVVEIATGAVVISGTAEDFYRGPSPRFVDEATSEVAVDFTWDEWDELIDVAYQAQADRHIEHESELVAIFSPDGVDWSLVELDDDPNRHLDAVLSIDGAFVLLMVTHGEAGETRWVLTSTDGVNWDRSDVDSGPYVYAVEAAGDGRNGAIGLSWSDVGSTIATTVDGRSWTTALTLGGQSDGRRGWFDAVAAGGQAVAALATIYPEPVERPLTITVASRTARFDVDGAAVEITDDLTGRVVLRATWDELQRAALGDVPMIADYADGATSFWADGQLVMTITDDEVHAAWDAAVQAEQAGVDHAVFVRIGGEWYEAMVPHVDGSTAGPLALDDGAVIVALTTYDDSPAAGAMEGEGMARPVRIDVLFGRFEAPTG